MRSPDYAGQKWATAPHPHNRQNDTNTSFIRLENMQRNLSARNMRSEKRTIFREH